MSEFHTYNLPETQEEILKSKLKCGSTEEDKCKAMDWLIKDMTEKKHQLSFMGWHHTDTNGYHHFKVRYIKYTEVEESCSMEDKSCTSCSS